MSLIERNNEENPSMENEIFQKILDKTMTKEELLQKGRDDFNLIPKLLKGVSSPKATIRYGCAKVQMDLSEEYPEKLYPYFTWHTMDFFSLFFFSGCYGDYWSIENLSLPESIEPL